MTAELDGVRTVSVVDREVDIFALFAELIIGWYRILKSGRRAECLNLQAGERIERAVAIKVVIAWRWAPGGDGDDGKIDAGASGRDPVLRHRDHDAGRLRRRPETAAAGQSRACRAGHGNARRIPEPQA